MYCIFYDVVEGAIPTELQEAVLSLSAVTAAPWLKSILKGIPVLSQSSVASWDASGAAWV